MNQKPPAEFHSVFGFGNLKSIFPVKKSAKFGNLVATLVFFGAAMVAFAFGLWNTYTRWQKFGPAVILRTITGPTIVAIVLFIIGLITAWNTFSNWKKTVGIYDQGFAYNDRKGLRSWRWSEINSMTSAITKHYTNGVYSGTTHVYTLLKEDGNKVILNDAISKVEEAAGMIREEIYPLLYAKNAQAYNAGKKVSFGPVSIAKGEGVQIGKKIFPWDGIDHVVVQKGFVQLAKKGEGKFSGASISAASVPNLEVLLSIANQVIGNKN